MNCLPFSTCSQNEFNQLFCESKSADQFTDLLSSHDFRSILKKFTYDGQLSNLNCYYYTIDEFNNKFCKIKKNVEFSLFHLNIRSLNSKLREFCTLMKLLLMDFDVIVLTEIWNYNVNFYQNILDGYCLFYEMPVSSSVGGVGLFIKRVFYQKFAMI